MDLIIQALIIFLTLVRIIIFIDVVLSYLSFLLPVFKILKENITGPILEPFYSTIKKYINTVIGPIELAPIILIIILIIIQSLIINIF